MEHIKIKKFGSLKENELSNILEEDSIDSQSENVNGIVIFMTKVVELCEKVNV